MYKKEKFFKNNNTLGISVLLSSLEYKPNMIAVTE